MGKKQALHTTASSSRTSRMMAVGCNTFAPNGCLLGVAIPAGGRALPAGAVPYECSNEQCPVFPFVHAECSTHLEQWLLARAAIHDVAKLWEADVYDRIRHICACKCGDGWLRRKSRPFAQRPTTPVVCNAEGEEEQAVTPSTSEPRRYSDKKEGGLWLPKEQDSTTQTKRQKKRAKQQERKSGDGRRGQRFLGDESDADLPGEPHFTINTSPPSHVVDDFPILEGSSFPIKTTSPTDMALSMANVVITSSIAPPRSSIPSFITQLESLLSLGVSNSSSLVTELLSSASSEVNRSIAEHEHMDDWLHTQHCRLYMRHDVMHVSAEGVVRGVCVVLHVNPLGGMCQCPTYDILIVYGDKDINQQRMAVGDVCKFTAIKTASSSVVFDDRWVDYKAVRLVLLQTAGGGQQNDHLVKIQEEQQVTTSSSSSPLSLPDSLNTTIGRRGTLPPPPLRAMQNKRKPGMGRGM